MRIISGSARGRKILSPQSSVTRPTLDRIKESIFNIIQNQIYGSMVLDVLQEQAVWDWRQLVEEQSFLI